MKFIIILKILFILSTIKCDNPNYPLNHLYNDTELQQLDDFVFIKEAFNFILTGSYNDTELGDSFDDK
jgi:hypothetical protein